MVLASCNHEAVTEHKDVDPLKRWQTYGSIQNRFIKVRPLPKVALSCDQANSPVEKNCKESASCQRLHFEVYHKTCREACRQTHRNIRRETCHHVRCEAGCEGEGSVSTLAEGERIRRQCVWALNASTGCGSKYPQENRLKVWGEKGQDNKRHIQIVRKS